MLQLSYRTCNGYGKYATNLSNKKRIRYIRENNASRRYPTKSVEVCELMCYIKSILSYIDYIEFKKLFEFKFN